VTRRDAVAGLLVAAAVAVWALGPVAGPSWPLAETRVVGVVVLVLGVSAVVVGGSWASVATEPEVTRPLAALGLLAALAAVATVLTGSAVTLSVLVLLTVVLWALATVHHLAARR
jgi:hypothetical protein